MTQPPTLLYLTNRDGLLFWKYSEVAMLRQEEGTGRLEATSAWGEVAHRPGPIDPYVGPPWVRIRRGILVHPAHARWEDGVLILPGGWRLEHGSPLPAPFPEPPPPVLPGIGVAADEVIMLRAVRFASVFITDRGEIQTTLLGTQAARLHPTLIRLGWMYVNRTRIRAVTWWAAQGRLKLDQGTALNVHGRAKGRLLAALGVPALDYLQAACPHERPLYHEGMRRWPLELATAPDLFLQQHFEGDARRLMFNLIWETLLARSQGRPVTHGRTHRGYWYNPVMPALRRAGLNVETAAFVDSDTPWPRPGVPPKGEIDNPYLQLLIVLEKTVQDYRLCTYTELGFEDTRPDLRRIGHQRPDVILLAEKVTVEPFVREIARRFDVTTIILGGNTKLILVEPLVRALRRRHKGAVHVVAYVDFDHIGWTIADGFIQHLARYGVEVRTLAHLVQPARFTPEELRALAYPLRGTNKSMRTRIDNFVARSGGVDGQAYGIHVDHLRPLERVLEAFDREYRDLPPLDH